MFLFGQSIPYGAPPGVFGPELGPDPSLLVLGGYNLYILGWIILVAVVLLGSVIPFFAILYLCELSVRLAAHLTGSMTMKVVLVMFRGLRRSPLRTALTYLALFVLTVVLTFIYAVLHLLSSVTAEKESNFKVIMTEKFSIPSMMPPSHLETLKRLIDRLPEGQRPGPDDVMAWSFTAGTTDPTNPRPENGIFFLALEPTKIMTMMEGMTQNDMPAADYEMMIDLVKRMEDDPRKCVVSKIRLEKMGLSVGQKVKVYGLNYKDVMFEFEIAGVLPDNKYDGLAFMNRRYLLMQIDAYEREKRQRHPLAEKNVNLIWIKVPSKEAYEQLAAMCNDPRNFAPAVKVETMSAGVGAWIDPLKDILFGMKYLMAPCMLAIMSLVVANAISISVRERRTELAVLKVLGFRPYHVMGLVLGEALLIGFFAGFIGTFLVWGRLTMVKFQVGMMGQFVIPPETLIYGPLLGMAVATAGSLGPALAARRVKVSEVFSKVP